MACLPVRKWNGGGGELDHDERTALGEHAAEVGFFLIGSARDGAAGFQARGLGALGFLDSHERLAPEQVLESVAQAALRTISGADVAGPQSNTAWNMRKLLRQESPRTVESWAAKCVVSTAFLRAVSRDMYGTSPKQVLRVYHAVRFAFAQHFAYRKLPCPWCSPGELPHREDIACMRRAFRKYGDVYMRLMGYGPEAVTVGRVETVQSVRPALLPA